MKKAFTLAEIILAIVIMGIVVSTLGKQAQENVRATINKQMTYAAYNLVKQNIREILATETTLPATGADFCTKLSDYFNPIMVDCNIATVPSVTDASVFSDTAFNFIAPNGLTFYNLNTDPNIPDEAVPTEGTYTFYIDIDGTEHGNNTLNDDILKFTTTLKGDFKPANDSIAANNAKYLSTGVYYKSGEDVTWVKRNVSFREAMCTSGKIDAADDYCTLPTAYSIDTTCAAEGITCDVEIYDVSLLIKR